MITKLNIFEIAQLAAGPQSIYAYVPPAPNALVPFSGDVASRIRHYEWFVDAHKQRQKSRQVSNPHNKKLK